MGKNMQSLFRGLLLVVSLGMPVKDVSAASICEKWDSAAPNTVITSCNPCSMCGNALYYDSDLSQGWECRAFMGCGGPGGSPYDPVQVSITNDRELYLKACSESEAMAVYPAVAGDANFEFSKSLKFSVHVKWDHTHWTYVFVPGVGEFEILGSMVCNEMHLFLKGRDTTTSQDQIYHVIYYIGYHNEGTAGPPDAEPPSEENCYHKTLTDTPSLTGDVTITHDVYADLHEWHPNV